MGLFDFVANAGQKLFGGKEKSDEEKAASLQDSLHKMALKGDGLKVKVSGGKAQISGRVGSQADKEKVVLALGNTEGIAQVEESLEVETPEPEAVFYTVRKGDTLSKIAKEHYGDAMKYPVIFEANTPMLKDPDKIYPGQVLRIPPLK